MGRPSRLGYGDGSVYEEKETGRWRGEPDPSGPERFESLVHTDDRDRVMGRALCDWRTMLAAWARHFSPCSMLAGFQQRS